MTGCAALKTEFRGFGGIVMAFLFLAMMIGVSFTPAVAFEAFGRHGNESRDLSAFPKWHSVLHGHHQSVATAGWRGQCTYGRCAEPFWYGIIQELQRRPMLAEKLEYANSALNSAPYIRDMINWGINDYWAMPLQFLLRNGDCEDYAIAKYMALREAGVSPHQMAVAIVQDQSLNLLHAVLLVQDSGATYVLDNQIKELRQDRDIHHYSPIYAINEFAWWHFF